MRRFLILLFPVLLLSHHPGHTQVNTFNRKLVFVNDTLSESVSGTLVLNNRYYVFGYLEKSNNPNIGIAEVDSAGNRLWVKSFGDSTKYFMTGFFHTAVPTSDGNIMMTGEYRQSLTPYTFFTLLVKFTPDGDTLWTKLLIPDSPLGSYSRGNGIMQTSDHGFAVYGDGPYGGIIYKTDPDGTIQWSRSILDDTAVDYSQISCMQELPGKQYLVGGTWIYPHVWEGRQNGMILLLDSTGSTIWSDTAHADLDFFVAWDGKSGFTGVGNRPVSMFNQSNRIHVTHFNAEGIQDKEGWVEEPVTFHLSFNLLVLPDTTFLLCGYHNYDSTFLLNFNRNCDILFYRKYFYPTTDPTKVISSTIMDGTLCPDGGILFGGEFDSLIGSTLTPTGWLLKTDRYGCLQPGCDPYGIYILRQPGYDSLHSFETAYMSVLATGDSLHYSWQLWSGSGWETASDTAVFEGNTDAMVVHCRYLAPGDYRFRCRISNHSYTVYSSEGLLHIILGVNEVHQREEVVLYPNPVKNDLKLKASEKIMGIRLFNYLGQECFPENQIENNHATLDLTKLIAGVYIIRIATVKSIYYRMIIRE
ncbi:MAG: T9SS type A sorting domain-containing protein [Bacteroidetes bacterium]|nr:T9SS type A sorting domain-containing protein [Bacteroidota bacterium]